jgi:hypothetical protein
VFLVQLLLPVYDNDGVAVAENEFTTVRRELTERFGGVTAYVRSPAAGLWKRGDGKVDRDDVVMVEVMAASLDRTWWGQYRELLEQRFRQETIVLRSIVVESL